MSGSQTKQPVSKKKKNPKKETYLFSNSLNLTVTFGVVHMDFAIFGGSTTFFFFGVVRTLSVHLYHQRRDVGGKRQNVNSNWVRILQGDCPCMNLLKSQALPSMNIFFLPRKKKKRGNRRGPRPATERISMTETERLGKEKIRTGKSTALDNMSGPSCKIL